MGKGGEIRGVRGWAFAGMAAFAALATLAFLYEREEEAPSYGFTGEVYHHGAPPHTIYFNQGVSEEVLKKLGDHLESIGYFVPEFGGIVQLHADEEGYAVYLTYLKKYWGSEAFLEEMELVGEDLEELVLEEPVSIILVDEDAQGVHRKVVR